MLTAQISDKLRVIAVEASPQLCEQIKAMFAEEIVEGRFVLIEKAIAPYEGEITFYANDVTIWGTIDVSHASEMQRRALITAHFEG